MDYYNIIKKLVGEIRPAGDASLDDDRFENLQNMAALVDSLLYDIYQVSRESGSKYGSVAKAGKYAKEILSEFKEYMDDKETD